MCWKALFIDISAHFDAKSWGSEFSLIFLASSPIKAVGLFDFSFKLFATRPVFFLDDETVCLTAGLFLLSDKEVLWQVVDALFGNDDSRFSIARFWSLASPRHILSADSYWLYTAHPRYLFHLRLKPARMKWIRPSVSGRWWGKVSIWFLVNFFRWRILFLAWLTLSPSRAGGW